MNDFDNKQICSYKDIDRFGFTCDVCGRKVNGCSIVNGMQFCAKCYQETFGKDNQQNEIQQLKQQLEEKDQQIKKRVMVYEKQFIVQTNEIYSLKQQLAEKDKEIERLKERLSVFDKFKDNYGYTNYDDSEILEDLQSRAFQSEDDTRVVNELLQFFNIFDENELVDKVKEPQTQLAIQELEKVKDTLKHFCDIHSDEYYGVKAEVKGIEQNVCESIDYQIKELKGE